MGKIDTRVGLEGNAFLNKQDVHNMVLAFVREGGERLDGVHESVYIDIRFVFPYLKSPSASGTSIALLMQKSNHH